MKLNKIFSPYNIRNFIEGNYLALRDRMSHEGIPKHMKEQALYRAMLCSPCLHSGRCVDPLCNCAAPNMFYAPKKVDPKGKWGPMLDSKDWQKFKEENEIELIESFEEVLEDTMRKNIKLERILPEWFVFEGNNVYDKMDPAFLVQLDELYYRCADMQLDIVSSWYTEEITGLLNYPKYSYLGRAVCIQLDARTLHKFILAALNMNFSVRIHEDFIYLDNREDPNFEVVEW